jgi:hypothetical protein
LFEALEGYDMKSVVYVNVDTPEAKNSYTFESGYSLLDHDIVIFNPTLPHYSRHSFSGGTSSISQSAARDALSQIKHWRQEITNALMDGKTIFYMLAQRKEDSYVTGIASSTAKVTNYNSASLSNYDSAPFNIDVTNAKGSKLKVLDSIFLPLIEALDKYASYEAYLNNEVKTAPIQSSNGSKALAAVFKLKDSEAKGRLVAIPYFDLDRTELTIYQDGQELWSPEASLIGKKLTKAFISIDKSLSTKQPVTPIPDWATKISGSKASEAIKKEIQVLRKKIKKIELEALQLEDNKLDNEKAKALMYETGKPLEEVIEYALKLLRYSVTNFKEGALEIDHIITSPDGNRLIGEAEGKDTSAISITKFRQLESNINEDFEREEVDQPAAGILFGNGFRLTKPDKRGVQFTEKCLINAKKLSTVLVRTSDLYPLTIYLQYNPNDEEFKSKCRDVLESKSGSIAVFPEIPPND